MCTLVILRRPGHDWPLLIAANRDEMGNRPWDAPGRHWPDRPHVIAGHDRTAGGSWLGVNDDRLAAAVLNRHGSLGPQDGKRSRGELPLDALDHAEAESRGDLSMPGVKHAARRKLQHELGIVPAQLPPRAVVVGAAAPMAAPTAPDMWWCRLAR